MKRVHYEAPLAGRLRGEMKKFLDWFEKESSTDLVLKAGVAHLWFVTIHPFEDGNGRRATPPGAKRADQSIFECSNPIPERNNGEINLLLVLNLKRIGR